MFAAETGQALSEILYILGDKLNKRVSSRIRYEVNRRIISSFLNNTYRFEEMKLNWAAVCGGSVGMTYIYMAPELFPLVKARIKACLETYLECFGDDGVSTEGVGYWGYGFAYYLYFEELYKEFAGEYLIPMQKKHKEIAMFFQRAYISGNLVISFSDTSIHNAVMPGMIFRLNDIFGDDVRILPEDSYAKKPVTGDTCYRFASCIRSFLWYKPEKIPSAYPKAKETIFLKDAQWYIKRTDAYVFAVKGGNNDEPHNHNDIGSFIISDGKEQLLADLGRGKYTQQYFEPETRYTHLCCSSFGHSVPIIGGMGQCEGKECKAKIYDYSDAHIAMDIGAAYNNADVVSLKRSFNLGDTVIRLTDEVDRKGSISWTDRFVSLILPDIKGDAVRIGSMKIYNSLGITPIVSSEEMELNGNGKRRVYLIDYETKRQKIEFRFEF